MATKEHSPTSKKDEIRALLEDPTPENVASAHDIAAGETDTETRRALYRELCGLCIVEGNWGGLRIFAPFTGCSYGESEPACLQMAIQNQRVNDALRLGERLGYEFGIDEVRHLARSLDTPGGPLLLRHLLEAGAGAEPTFDTGDWVQIAERYGRGALSDLEAIAYRLTFRHRLAQGQ